MTKTVKFPKLPKVTVKLVREPKPKGYEAVNVSNPYEAEAFLAFLKDKPQEHFVVVLLDSRNDVIGLNVVSIGSMNASIVNPPDVFRPALLSNARSILLAHNHPSGNTKPSEQDIACTKQLLACAEVLNIQIMDHLVIGDKTHSIRGSHGYLWSY